MEIKSGWKTTEFSLSLAAALLGAFVASGVLPSEHWAIKVAGIVLIGLASLGYSSSRGAAKGAGPLALVALVVLASGCPGWQVKTRDALGVTFKAGKAGGDLAEQYLHPKCLDLAKLCAANPTSGPTREARCPALARCQATKGQVDAAVVALHRVVIAGLLAVELGEEGLSSGWLAKAISALAELRKTLLATGLLGG